VPGGFSGTDDRRCIRQ